MARGGSAPAYGYSEFLAVTDHEKAGRISDFLFLLIKKKGYLIFSSSKML
jgi:hypothetical protein